MLALNLASSWPLERRASARSRLNSAVPTLLWGVVVAVAEGSVVVAPGALSAGFGDCDEDSAKSFWLRTSFSASAEARRSASWEPDRVHINLSACGMRRSAQELGG